MSEPAETPPSSSTNGERSTSDWFRRSFHVLRRLSGWLIWGLVAIGLLLRFTVQDRFHPWAVIYYMTPIPALPIWLLLAGLAQATWRRDAETKSKWSSSRLSPARLSLWLGLGFVVWTLCSEYVVRAEPTRPEDFRLVFWNTMRVKIGVNRCATYLRSWDAPVIALVEADKDYKLVVERWQNELPEYQVAGTHFGGLIAVKGRVKSQTSHLLSPSSWCEQFDLSIGADEFTVLLVDISSQLSLSRRAPLQDLANLAEKLNDRPVVIMGDFNTPDDSVWLGPLRSHCRQAFRERGTGYAATWPMPLPVLTLDQVWVNDLVAASRCEHGWTVYSDHRPVISNVSFRRRR